MKSSNKRTVSVLLTVLLLIGQLLPLSAITALAADPVFSDEFSISETATLYHIVKFVDYDGTLLKEELVESGMNATPPNAPIRPNYSFAGWEGTYTAVTTNRSIFARYENTQGGGVSHGSARFGVMLDDAWITLLTAQISEDTTTGTQRDYLMAVPTGFDGVTYAATVWGGSKTSYGASVADREFSVTGQDGSWYPLNKQNPSGGTIYMIPDTGHKFYTVSFIGLNKRVIATEVFADGATVTPPSQDKIDEVGYTFLGWDQALVVSGAPLTLTGQYQKTVFHDVTFVLEFDDGTPPVTMPAVSVGHGEAATEPSLDTVPAYYDFLGWDMDFSSVIDDMTVTGTFALKKYDVTFIYTDLKGYEHAETTTYKHGETVVAPTAPDRVGYTFEWFDAVPATATATVTINGGYVQNEYDVEFAYLDAGGEWTSETVQVLHGETAVVPSGFTPGADFLGWDRSLVHITQNQTITAVYKDDDPDKFLVLFTDETGTVIYGKEYVELAGTVQNIPADPVKEGGYEFFGWLRGGTQVYDDFTNITADTIFYATFGDPEFFDVTFLIEGDPYKIEQVINGDFCIEPPAPDAADWPVGAVGFRGWYADMTGTTEFDFGKPITAPTTVYGLFRSTYLISYRKDAGDDVYETKTVRPDQFVVRPAVSPQAPENMVFTDEWYDESVGPNTKFEFYKTTDKDIVLVPIFDDHTYVIFISAGSQVPSQFVKVNETATVPTPPTRAGYTFQHWSTTPDGATAYDFGTPVTAQTILYAVWAPAKVGYTVVYWLEKPNIIGDPGTTDANYLYAWTTRVNDPDGEISGTMFTMGGTQATTLANAQTTGKTAIRYSTFSHAKEVEINGNGTTVVNVYFKRNLYRFNFLLNTEDPTAKLVVGGNTYTPSTATYGFDAKFEQDVSAVWPTDVSSDTMGFGGWRSNQGFSVIWNTKRLVITNDLLVFAGPATNATAIWEPTVARKVFYLIESLDGTGDVTNSHNGRVYKLESKYTQAIAVKETRVLEPKGIEGTVAITRTINMDGGKQASDVEAMGSGNWVDVPLMEKDTKPFIRFFYDRLEFTVTYNTMGGTFTTDINYDKNWKTLKYGASYFKPADPVRTGYIFKGWYADVMDTAEFDFTGATMPARNVGYFAKWEPTALTLNYFDAFPSGALVGTKGIEIGGYASDLAGYVKNVTSDPAKGVFQGWSWVINGGILTEASYQTPLYTDTNLYATWRTNGFHLYYVLGSEGVTGTPPTETKTFDLGTEARVQDGRSDLVVPDPATQHILGWRIVGDTSGTVYYPGSLITMYRDTTLEPVIAKKEDTIKITYVENYKGSTTSTTWFVNKNSTIMLAGRLYPNYLDATLVGWAKNASAATPDYALGQTGFAVGETDITLYGVWAGECNVYFVANAGGGFLGKVAKQVQWQHIPIGRLWGVAGIVPTPHPDPGYYFVGWTPALKADDFAIVQDLIFYANFAPKKDITLVADSAEKDWDGTALTQPRLTQATIEALALLGVTYNVGDYLMTSDSTQTDVNDRSGQLPKPNKIASYVFRDGAGTNISYQFNTPTLVDGELTVHDVFVNVYYKVADGQETWGNVSEDHEQISLFDGGNPLGSTAAENDGFWFDHWEREGTTGTYSPYATITPDLPARGESATYIAYFGQKQEITLKAGSAEKDWDGTPLTQPLLDQTTIDMLLAMGLSYDPTDYPMTADSTQTDVNDRPGDVPTPNKIASYIIRDTNGNDVTHQYTVTVEDGELTVHDVFVDIYYVVAPGQDTMGTVSLGHEQVSLFDGTVQGSTATANYGSTFDHWEKDGVPGTYSSDGTIVPPAEDATYIAYFVDGPVEYEIHYFLQNLSGGYDYQPNADELRTAINNTDVAVLPTDIKTFTGFAHDGVFDQGTAVADPMLILEVYYNREQYTVRYEYIGVAPAGAPPVPADATYTYGETVTRADPAQVAGYTFHGWDTTSGLVFTGNDFPMPAHDVLFTGYFTQNVVYYTLTIHHIYTDTGLPAAPDQVTTNMVAGQFYEGFAYTFPNYTASPTYLSGYMPAANHEETIWYTPGPPPPPPPPPPPEETTRTRTTLYTILDADIPLAGIAARNVGECFE